MDASDPLRELEFRTAVEARAWRSAGEWLVRTYAREVVSFCATMVRDRAVAEDLAQDAFSRALATLPTFRNEASARTWLLAIARNRCIDHLRRAKLDPWKGSREDGESILDDVPDEARATSELLADREDLRAALSVLDENDRALVVLRLRHGMEYDELASAFGLRAGTVRMRVSRALAAMRERLVVDLDQVEVLLERGPVIGRARAGAPGPTFGAAPGGRAPAASRGAPPPSIVWPHLPASGLVSLDLDVSIALERRLQVLLTGLPASAS